MSKDDSDRKKLTDQDPAFLKRENEALSEQVKRLVKAESKLYQFQEELDVQLKEYKDLYLLNRKLYGTFEIDRIFQHTVEHVIENLDFERVIVLEADDGVYCARAQDGYYEQHERSRVAELVLERQAPVLAPLLAGAEYVICTSASNVETLVQYRDWFLMQEYFIYPIGIHLPPHALLVTGNSGERAEFYRRVNDTPGTLLTMGNLMGLISSAMENNLYYQQLQKAVEHEKLAEAKYRTIFERAVEGIFQITPSGRYLDANPSMARMLGYESPSELINAIEDMCRQLCVDPQQHAQLAQLLEKNDLAEGFELQMCRKDGSQIWATISARAVRDGSGAVICYEGTAEEITARKEAEQAVRESEQKYRQLSEVLEQRIRQTVDELRQKDKLLLIQSRQAVMGEMISNIAHQWRQPLNVLGLLAQNLELAVEMGDYSKTSISEYVSKTMEILQQLSKTIDDFRFFFKPGREQSFNVADMIRKSLSLLEGSLKAAKIRIEIDQRDEPIIQGDPGQFSQVLVNILINARDALVMQKIEEPLIRIGLMREGDRTVVTITDNAGGVPESILEKIFEPYFTTKGPEHGTGIGLFMCKTIIEKNMFGSIAVRNVAGGAEFCITI